MQVIYDACCCYVAVRALVPLALVTPVVSNSFVLIVTSLVADEVYVVPHDS